MNRYCCECLCLIMLGAFNVSSPYDITCQVAEAPLKLKMELRSATFVSGKGIAGEIALENISSGDVTVLTNGDLRQYVEFTIKNGKGETVSEDNYGSNYIVNTKADMPRTIPAMKTWKGNVLPSEALKNAALPPGEYKIKARFTYKDIRIESKEIGFKITEAAK